MMQEDHTFKRVLQTSIAPDEAPAAPCRRRVDPSALGAQVAGAARLMMWRACDRRAADAPEDHASMHSSVCENVARALADLKTIYEGRGLVDDITAGDIVDAAQRAMRRCSQDRPSAGSGDAS